MIYGELKQKNKISAIYLFGTSINDITGEVIIYTEFKKPSIITQPRIRTVPLCLLTKLVVKYKDKFIKGIFPEKISYEC